MDIKNVYQPLKEEAFSLADAGKKTLKDDFLSVFLAAKVSSSKKREIEENLHSYTQFSASERKVFKRKLYNTKSKSLTAKEKRSLKLFDIPKSQKFSDFFGLHRLWEQYAMRLLDIDPSGTRPARDSKQWPKQIQSADFHGALVTVAESKNKSLVGMVGIVVQETRNVFKLATESDVVKVVPKNNCVFRLELAGFVFTIYGNSLVQRSAARSGKKFKSKGYNEMMILE